MTDMKSRSAAIDARLASLALEHRQALSRLRDDLHSIVPDLEECISYGMPAFRFEGQVVAGFMATAKGCSYYPFSGSTLATLAQEIERYSHTKSALHFDPKRGLPVALVKKLLRVRIAEVRLKSGPSKRGTPKSVKRVSAQALAKAKAQHIAAQLKPGVTPKRSPTKS